jgi:tetratricopeptide (TPR) repeat protein
MRALSLVCTVLVLAAGPVVAQSSSDQLQVEPPPARKAAPPAPDTPLEQLEAKGDHLRSEKAYLDALDYYRAALAKSPNHAHLLNKAGITELMMQRYKDARKHFEKSIKNDREFSDAYNNLGVVYYMEKRFGKAVKQYEKAIKLKPDLASYYGNLGTAYFAKKDYEKATIAYTEAIRLDPGIFDRVSRGGISAQMSSPEDRARFSYVLAKLYAKSGLFDQSLQYLRRALEEGYPQVENAYKDEEFAELRKDPRFDQLMHERPTVIPQ